MESLGSQQSESNSSFDSHSDGPDSSAHGHSTAIISQRKRPRRAIHTRSKWQASWSKYHLKASKKGATFAYCTVCSTDFSVSGGGVHDVKRHCRTLKHTRLMQIQRDYLVWYEKYKLSKEEALIQQLLIIYSL